MKATCHCGALELEVDLEDGLATARRCDCSYCRRRGAVVVDSVPEGVTVVRGAEALGLYEFGTRTAKHYFCTVCGISTHSRRRSDPTRFAVNVACLEGVNPRDLGEVPWFDGINHPSDRTG